MNKINFLDSVDWSFPVPISYGPNRINDLPDICKTNNLAFINVYTRNNVKIDESVIIIIIL